MHVGISLISVFQNNIKVLIHSYFKGGEAIYSTQKTAVGSSFIFTGYSFYSHVFKAALCHSELALSRAETFESSEHPMPDSRDQGDWEIVSSLVDKPHSDHRESDAQIHQAILVVSTSGERNGNYLSSPGLG